MLIAAITALSGVIVFLFKRLQDVQNTLHRVQDEKIEMVLKEAQHTKETALKVVEYKASIDKMIEILQKKV